MGQTKNNTAISALAAYEAAVSLGADEELGLVAKTLRASFSARTGVFSAEDPWFELRSRAFWDDALTTGFADHAARRLPDFAPVLGRFRTAHRGLFVASGDLLVDVWSGAELEIQILDEAQALAFAHAEGLVDARVVAASPLGPLHVLPGAFFHPPDARTAIDAVVRAARAVSMKTGDVLDALMRMELVFRTSSRVKASFAYRASALDRSQTKR